MTRRQDARIAAQHPAVVPVAGATPQARGFTRGRVLGERIAAAHAGYVELLDAAGGVGDLAGALDRTAQACRDWWPEGVVELEAIAAGAGLPADVVWLLNARTELLAEARRNSADAAARECSVAVRLCESSVGIQTWDWHDHLADVWHPVRETGGRCDWAGITEASILAKIGVNSAGIALHLDILFHDDDHAGGVPVHLVAARILTEARDLDEAIGIAVSAPVSASSALTLHDGARGTTVELSPRGARLVPAVHGWLVHANRFRHPELQAGEHATLADADALARQHELRRRTAAPGPATTAGLLALLDSEPDAPGQLSCVPAADAVLGDRWHTLVTVVTHPGERRLEFLAGVPLGGAPLRELRVHPDGHAGD